MDFILAAYVVITVTLPAALVGLIWDPKVNPHGFVIAWISGVALTAILIPAVGCTISRLKAAPSED